ncbi:MAG: PA2778 family cysteine peptidase [Campylobacterales bacterium]|nr:PA2778 family cysteine peptidase [Campylobacterales bacterium]
MRTALLLAVGLSLWLGGCAPSPRPSDHSAVFLNVPFTPPQNELCAATSLSSLSLYWQANLPFTPRLTNDDLERLTLIPAKHGTLQDELTAAARQNGFIAYPLPPSTDALLQELANGHPVILLLNRGIALYPLWHYSVITGYDPQSRSLLAHFADTPNEAIALRTVEKMWERSGYWGIVPLPPSRTAATATPKAALRAIWDVEHTVERNIAIAAYTTALERWSDDRDLLFALASALGAQGKRDHSESLYRRILERDPNHLFALNNLAWILYEKGEKESARAMLQPHLQSREKGAELLRRSYAEMK